MERLHPFAHAREARDVREEHGNVAADGLKARRFLALGGLEDLIHHLGRVVALQPLTEAGLPLALDAHGREVGHGGEQVLVLAVEAALGDARLQVDDAGGEARVQPRVHGEDRHPVLHGRARDGAADGIGGRAGLFLPHQFGHQFALRVREENGSALTPDLFRDELHHAFQQFLKAGRAQQRTRHRREPLEEGLAIGHRRARGLGGRLREHLLQRGVGNEDGARGVEGPVFHGDLGGIRPLRPAGLERGADGPERFRAWLLTRGGPIHPLDEDLAEQDAVALLEGPRLRGGFAVHGGAVQALHVHHMGLTALQEESRVDTAHGVHRHAQARRLAAAERDAIFGEIHRMERAVYREENSHGTWA